MAERPLIRYEPNPLLAWAYQRFFEHIEVDDAWARAVREADARGTVVYVLRNLSFVDFFALDYLTKKLELPQVRFANDLGLWLLEPMGRGWLNALRPKTGGADVEDLRRAVRGGAPAALFLKRPATLLEPGTRGKIEGDPYIRAIFDVQRASERPILLVPQVFVWTKHQDEARQTAVDALFGPRAWPGQARQLAQFLSNYRHVTLRSGEPVDVKSFLAQQDGQPDDVLVRRITYTLLRRLERERKAVVGPAKKPADRLREEVVRSPRLQKVISDMAGEGEHERQVLTWRALAMVREMEAAVDMNAVGAMDKALEQVTTRIYQDVEVDTEGIERLRAASKEGTLVLLPSHKSHVDYMILSQVLYRNHLPLPLIAAGDNLNFWPMGALFRRAGAFFIRRSFHGDRLYAAVVDAYIRRLLKDGWPLEFFLEGGRSRTGKLLSPKVGILSIVVDAALGVPDKKVFFCPVSIGYERFVEEKAFVRELTGGEKQKEDVRGLVRTLDVLASRYGRLNVQFGELLTLDDELRALDPSADLAKMTPAKRRALVTRLAHRTMNEINRVTAVTPGALVAIALLTHGRRGLPHEELVQRCERLAEMLKRFGARFAPSLVARGEGVVRREALREALELFVRAGHVEAHVPGAGVGAAKGNTTRVGEGVIYVVPPEARISLDLSKNVAVHFFVSRALVATALLAAEARARVESSPRLDVAAAQATTPSIALHVLRDRVQTLSRLFKYEFAFRADAPFEQIFGEEVEGMRADREIEKIGETIVVAADRRAQVELYASILRSFVESYRVAARGLGALLRGALAPKDLAKRAITAGERMFLAGEIERREAVSRPAIENAYAAFVDQGYLRRQEGKLALAESFANASAVKTIEARIVAFLPRQ